jgi:hypothetical protein
MEPLLASGSAGQLLDKIANLAMINARVMWR